jgi:hypothetical protein
MTAREHIMQCESSIYLKDQFMKIFLSHENERGKTYFLFLNKSVP